MNIHGRISAMLLVAALLASLSGCSDKSKEGAAAPPPAAIKGAIITTLATTEIPDNLEAAGTIKARSAAVIAARIPGVVTGVLVKEGDKTGKGKLLITIEAAETAAGAAGAEAGLEEAKRGVDEAKSRKKLADATFQRFQKLFQGQAISKQEFDIRQTDMELAEQGLAKAEARLAQARETLRSASAVAGYARITAPLSGTITDKKVEPGMTVFPGMPLLTVEEEGNYRLEAAAPESFLGKVKAGQQVKVIIDSAPAAITGQIVEVAPAADPASRTFIVKVDVAGKGLRSGMFGRVLFPAGSRRGITIPAAAVVERGALTSVWSVDKQNVARMRLVKVGKTVGPNVEILSGLAEGERVVTGGAEKVSDGTRLE